MAYGVVGVDTSAAAAKTVKQYGVVGLTKKNKERGGIVGFFEHLGEDIKDAAVGLPMGLVNTVEHPIRTAHQMATSTWQTWSPLFHGNVGEFAHDFAEHPLAPILDIAAVLSLGAGGVAKVGETGALGSRVAELATRRELQVAGATADLPTMTRALSRRGGSRLRQNIVHEITGRAHPFMSDEKLYKTLSQKEASRQQFALNARMTQLGKAYKDLDDPIQQRNVFLHMYHQIRSGPARAVKLSSLAGGKAPKGWRFVTEHTAENDDLLFDPEVHGRMLDKAIKERGPAEFTDYVEAPKGHVFVQNPSGRSWRLVEADIKKPKGAKATKPSEPLLSPAEVNPVDPMIEAAAMQVAQGGMAVEDVARMFNVDPEAIRFHLTSGAHDAEQARILSNAQLDERYAAAETTGTAEDYLASAEAKLRGESPKRKVTTREDEEGNLTISGGYKQDAFKEIAAPEGHVLTKTKAGYKLTKIPEGGLSDAVKGRGFVEELYDTYGRFTTTRLEKAARQKGGKEVLIVPERAVRAYSQEAGHSASFIRKAYDYPTRAWRAAVLNLRPAYVVNNSVGNMFMMMMNHGDWTGARAWVDSLHQVKGKSAINRLGIEAGKTPHWMETHFGDEIANTFAGDATRGFEGPGTARKLARGVMPLNMKIERMFRRSLINSEMRRAPEVRRLMKRGMSFEEAATKALKNNPGLRARVLTDAHNTLGDYHAMSTLDRHIRDLIPFWAWDKTIARHTAKAFEEQPTKAAIGTQIGQQGTERTEKELGEIPSFLKGAIPLPGSFGPIDRGRKSIITTQGLNPYGTIPDLASSVQAMLGGGDKPVSEAVGALIGPIPTIAVEGLTGQRGSGAKIPNKGFGPFGNAAYDILVNLPPVQLGAAAIGDLPPSFTIQKRTGARRDKLYQKDWQSIVSSWLGVPTRKLSPEAAYAMAQEEMKRRQRTGQEAR